MGLSDTEKNANKIFFAKLFAMHVHKTSVLAGIQHTKYYQNKTLKNLCKWAEEESISLAIQLSEDTSLDLHPVLGLTIPKDLTSDEDSRLFELLKSTKNFTRDLKNFIENLAWVKTEKSGGNKKIYADDAGRNPGIKGKLAQGESSSGNWGVDVDFRTILGDLIENNFQKITKTSTYISNPIESKLEIIAGKVNEALSANFDGEFKIIIPITSQTHWTMLSLVIKNHKIQSAKHVDSVGGPRQSKDNAIQSSYLSAIKSDSFAENFAFTKINRGEQNNGWSCMDYTIQNALREAGVRLVDDEGNDYISLSYGSGAGDRARQLRTGFENIILARDTCGQVEKKDLTSSELQKLNQELEQSFDTSSFNQVSETTPLIATKQDTKSINSKNLLSKIKDKIVSLVRFIWNCFKTVITLPYIVFKICFNLGENFIKRVDDAFSSKPVAGDMTRVPTGFAGAHYGSGMAIVREAQGIVQKGEDLEAKVQSSRLNGPK